MINFTAQVQVFTDHVKTIISRTQLSVNRTWGCKIYAVTIRDNNIYM